MKKVTSLQRKLALFAMCTLLLCLLTTCVKEVTVGSIQGIVTNSITNEPIQGVNVSLSPGGLSTVTGSDGRYEFKDLEAGQYTVQGSAEGYETNTKSITIEPEKVASGDMTLKRIVTEGNIQGIVSNATTNEPVQGANITLSPLGLSTVTGSDGRYEFVNLPAGQYTVQGVKSGFESNTKNITVIAGNTSSGDMMLTPEVSDFKLNVEYLDFGTSFNQLTFKIINLSTSLPISWSITESYGWLEATPSSGNINAGQEVSVLVDIDRTKIDQSTTGNLVVEACDKSIVLPVNVTVSGTNGPNLQLSETSLDFGTSATSLSFYVLNTGPANTSLNWTCSNVNVDWLTLSPTSGNTAGGSNTPVMATIDRDKIDGVVSTSVTVSGAGSTATITFSAAKEGVGAPILQLSEGSLNFGDSETTLSFLVKNVGSTGTTLDWTIVEPDVDWLTLTPMTGHTNAGSGTQVTAAVDRTKFTGTVTTTIRVNSQNNNANLSVTAVNNQPVLEVSTETVSFGGVSTTQTFTVKNAGNEGTSLHWSIAAPTVNWLTVSPSSGNLNAGSSKTVTLTVDRTKFTGDVSTTLQVTAGNQSASVLVTATTAQATLVVSLTSVDFGKISTTKTFTIKNEGEEGSVLNWTVAEPMVDWLAVSPATGSLNANGSRVVTLTLDRTKFTGNVSTTLQVSGEGQTATINVTASTAQATLELNQTSVDFGKTSTTKTFTVKNVGEEGSVLNWTIANPTVNWLTVSPTSGSTNANSSQVITLTVDRTLFTGDVSTNVVVSAGGQTATVSVTASTPQATLTVTPTLIDFETVSNTKTFTIKNEGDEGSVLDWTVSEPTVNWLAVTPTSGSLNANGSRVVTLTIDRTLFTGSVSTTLQVSGAGQSETITVAASTAQATLAVTPTAVDFGKTSITKTITVKNEGEAGSVLNWTIANPTVDWLSVSPSSGSTNANTTTTVTLTIDRTKFTGDVSTTIVVTAGSQTASVTVTASTPIPNLLVTPTTVDFGKLSNTKTITVKNNGEDGSVLNWTIAPPTVDWLTVSLLSGSLNANATTNVTLTIDRSLFDGDVSTTLNVAAGTQTATVSITASTAEYELEVTPEAVDFGTISNTKTFTVKNNGETGSTMNWNLETIGVAWLTASPMSGSLSANQTTTVTLTLDRTQFTGNVSTVVDVTAGTQSATLTVTAATPVPAMTVSPTSVDFGTISTTQQVTITNTGEAGSVLSYSIETPSVTWLTATPSSGTINAGLNSTVTLIIDRNAFMGVQNTNFIITGAGTTVTLPITVDNTVLAVDGLIAYYTFDDGTVTDWGGNYNGINNGATASTDVPGTSGFSMEFDGANSHLQIPYPIFQTGTTWSYNVWFKTGYNYAVLFGTNNSTYQIKINQYSKLYIYPSDGWVSTNTVTSYLNNQWHMLTVTWNGSVATIYLDGVLFETANRSSFGWFSSYSTTYIGADMAYSYHHYFNGKMDNIRTYNRALTQAEITVIYNARQ